jgi:hypothetical protein
MSDQVASLYNFQDEMAHRLLQWELLDYQEQEPPQRKIEYLMSTKYFEKDKFHQMPYISLGVLPVVQD